ncbi:MAG: hypothetical protein GXY79_01490 [Chloroflexi bacterium]|nr:hypothetical protein [Chloroflexota bacterium]
MTSQERAALAVVWLNDGAQLTTAELAERLGMTWGGAWRLMHRLARVLPIDQEDGRWFRVEPL